MTPVANGSTAIGEDRVDVLRYHDAHLFDRMHARAQLSDAQFDAAQWVLARFNAAGLEPSVTGSYSPRGWTHGEEHAPDDHCPLTEWRRLLDGLRPLEADALQAACQGQHPGIVRMTWLHTALDRVGREQGVGCG